MGERAGIDDDRLDALARGAQQPSDQVAFVVGLLPDHLVAERLRAVLDGRHDLLEGLRSVRLGVAAAERAEVRTEQIQDVHAAAPISSRTSTIVGSGTSSTITGRPT